MLKKSFVKYILVLHCCYHDNPVSLMYNIFQTPKNLALWCKALHTSMHFSPTKRNRNTGKNFFWLLCKQKCKSYKGRISKLLCSPFLEDAAADGSVSLLSPVLICWTGGGLTTVMDTAALSDRWFLISLCSWHMAHQCMQQCTRQGSHGEFCKQATWLVSTWPAERHLQTTL